MLQSLYHFTRPLLQEQFETEHFKKFQATQLFQWIYQKRLTQYDQMTNLSKNIRDFIKQKYDCSPLKILASTRALDGTRKYLFELSDGKSIETVSIPMKEGKRTICVSTQVGCSMGCKFCLTSFTKQMRNLTTAEIVGQIMSIDERDITNVVYMGMGEPLLNLDNVIQSIHILTDELGLNLSYRRITVSTCGLVPQMKEFTERSRAKLAISLHGTTNEQRNSIMPVNRKYPLESLLAFCRQYPASNHHRITFEYVLLKGINDTLDDAKRLVKLLSGLKCKINLIQFNNFPNSPYVSPSIEKIKAFQDYLIQRNYTATLRKSKGADILAACGQLDASRNKK